MNVAVVYVFPTVLTNKYYPLAKRFADSWRKHPGENLHVVFNGPARQRYEEALFAGIPHTFHAHDNNGWDIGAFQVVAATVRADLMIFFGACVELCYPGWFPRMVETYVNQGPHLYGAYAYNYPQPHIRTTAFWCPPDLLNSYPQQVGTARSARYAFEHGTKSFTRHVLDAGFEADLVTRSRVFPFSQWDGNAPGPADALVWDQHTHP